jgi:acetyltransferase-like isoleucine patch superfamily enzyme
MGWLRSRDNIAIEGSLVLIGRPRIDIRPRARLELGHNVTLRSTDVGYHLSMYAPTKLFADRDGALIRIGRNTRINGSCIHAQKSIRIGENCLIAANCQICDGNGHSLSFPDVADRIRTEGSAKAVVIEDSVWLGTGCVVLSGVRIGTGSVIGANSVVTGDIPPMVVALGNPAVVIKDYSSASCPYVFSR